MTESPLEPDGRAVKIWLDAATDLFSDARSTLSPVEFDTVVDVFSGLIARYWLAAERGAHIKHSRAPAEVIRLELEGDVVHYIEAANKGDAARVREWVDAREDLRDIVQRAEIAGRR